MREESEPAELFIWRDGSQPLQKQDLNLHVFFKYSSLLSSVVVKALLVHVLTNILFCCSEKSQVGGCYLNFVHSNKWMERNTYHSSIDIWTLLYIWISKGVSFFCGGVLQNMTSIALNIVLKLETFSVFSPFAFLNLS